MGPQQNQGTAYTVTANAGGVLSSPNPEGFYFTSVPANAKDCLRGKKGKRKAQRGLFTGMDRPLALIAGQIESFKQLTAS